MPLPLVRAARMAAVNVLKDTTEPPRHAAPVCAERVRRSTGRVQALPPLSNLRPGPSVQSSKFEVSAVDCYQPCHLLHMAIDRHGVLPRKRRTRSYFCPNARPDDMSACLNPAKGMGRGQKYLARLEKHHGVPG